MEVDCKLTRNTSSGAERLVFNLPQTDAELLLQMIQMAEEYFLSADQQKIVFRFVEDVIVELDIATLKRLSEAC